MEETETKLDEKTTEENSVENKTQEAPKAFGVSGNKPEFNVVQPDYDQNGKKIFTNVGAMWKNVSKNGNEFYMLKIGELRLLVFPNDRK
ncbi:MAG: hypothetical protein ABII39_01790 [Candidatus Micrarchaeota archaeon]